MTGRTGLVALVGRPNVGKSTLLNALVGRKLSIVSPKPQTTRHRVVGVMNRDPDQVVFVDTPGQAETHGQALNRALDRAAHGAMQDVDLVLWLVEALRWTDADEQVRRRLQSASCPVGLVLTKIDRIKDKKRLLPELAALGKRLDPAFVVPVSSTRRSNLDALVDEILKRMPEGEPFYPPDVVDPQDLRFTAAERVREQLFLRLHQELPYRIAVGIDELREIDGRLLVRATIWLDRASHKGMVIGQGGATLKAVGTAARHELEQLTGQGVDLKLWVKVREGWADNEQSLRAFGYGGDAQA